MSLFFSRIAIDICSCFKLAVNLNPYLISWRLSRQAFSLNVSISVDFVRFGIVLTVADSSVVRFWYLSFLLSPQILMRSTGIFSSSRHLLGRFLYSFEIFQRENKEALNKNKDI